MLTRTAQLRFLPTILDAFARVRPSARGARAAVLAVSIVSLGCGGAPRRPARALGGVEIVPDERHAQNVEVLAAFPAPAPTWLVTRDGVDVRAWSVDPRGEKPISLQRVFRDARSFWYSAGRGERDWCFLFGRNGSRLTWIGEWTDVTPPGTRLPPMITSVLYYGAEEPRQWLGLAVQEKDDADGDGVAGEWTLIYSADQVTWRALTLPGGPERVAEFARMGAKDIVVRELRPDGGRGRFFFYRREDGDRWSRLPLQDEPAAIEAVNVLAEDTLVELRESGGEEAPRRYFTRDPRGAWTPLGAVVAGAPTKIHASTALGKRRILGIQEEGDADNDNESFAWSYFFRSPADKDRWVPLLSALRLPTQATITSIKPFLDARGLGVRIEAGQGAGTWSYYLWNGKAWIGLNEAIPELAKNVWDVRSFGGDRGIGVQFWEKPRQSEAGSAREPEEPRPFRWYVRASGASGASGASWQEIHTLIPAAPAGIADMQGDAIQSIGLREQPPEVVGKAVEEMAWRFYVPNAAGRWTAIDEAIPSLKSVRVTQVGGDPNTGALFAKDDRQVVRWFLRGPARAWRPLSGAIERPQAAKATGLLGRVREAKEILGGRGVELTLHAERGDRAADHRFLIAGQGGVWADVDRALPGAPAEIAAVDGDRGLALVAPKGPPGSATERLAFVRGADGAWEPWKAPSSASPAPIRSGYSFLGGKGVALEQEPTKEHRKAWTYWLRGERGWAPLADALPQLPPRLNAVVGLEGENALVALEEADADNNGRPEERIAYIQKGTAWHRANDLLPKGAPALFWQASGFAGGRGISLLAESGPAKPEAWRHYLRDGERFIEFRAALPGIPNDNDIEPPLGFWGTEGILIQEREGTQAGASRLYRRAAGGSFRPLRVAALPARVAEVRGVFAWRLLAALAKGAPDTYGVAATWSVFVEDGAGQWIPFAAVGGGVPIHIADLVFFEAEGKLALQTFEGTGTRRSPVYRWFERRDDGSFGFLGSTGDPGWGGFGWTGGPDLSVRFDGAAHVVDGAAAASVPRPVVWYAAERPGKVAGRVLGAPSIVPEGVALAGSGSDAVVLVYRDRGRAIAAAFSRGTVDAGVLATAPPGEGIPVFFNRLESGAVRVHLRRDPTRWITFFEQPARGKVWYDNRGYFFEEKRGTLPDTMRLIANGKARSLRQLEPYLYRPDRLEERLGLAAGALFRLSIEDRRRVEEARSRTSETIDWTTIP